MGLAIREIVPKVEISLDDLKGKTIVVDAFNTLYQFLSTIRQMDGTPLKDEQDRVTSHLSGILYRNAALMEAGIKLVYVFDGEAPALKAKTHKKRQAVRDSAQASYDSAKAAEDISLMRRYASQLLRLDDEMLKESKELLTAMGICVIQAPSEGEAQAAHFCATHQDVYAVSSQDYDSLLFGAPTLIQNLTLARRKKTFSGYTEVHPEMISLEHVLEELGVSREQLICLGILVGTDYNPKGVPGIGQKKALSLVQAHTSPEEIFAAVSDKMDELSEEDSFDWKEIFDLFMNHPVTNEAFSFPKIDAEKIRHLLISEHGFSSERVEKQISRLQEIERKSAQKGLDQWF